MLHGAIKKIKVARFFVDHGVYCVFYCRIWTHWFVDCYIVLHGFFCLFLLPVMANKLHHMV